VTLRGLDIHRGAVSGRQLTAKVIPNWGNLRIPNIAVMDGSITFDARRVSEGASQESKAYNLLGFSLRSLTILKGSGALNLYEVDGTTKGFCARQGVLTVPGLDAIPMHKVCVDRGLREIRVDELKVSPPEVADQVSRYLPPKIKELLTRLHNGVSPIVTLHGSRLTDTSFDTNLSLRDTNPQGHMYVESKVKIAYLGDKVSIDFSGLKLNHDSLAKNAEFTLPVTVNFRLGQSFGEADATIGGATLELSALNHQINGSADCRDWVKALPSPIPPVLVHAMSGGSLNFEITFNGTPKVSISNTCKAVCSAPEILALKTTFEYNTYVDGKVVSRLSGPNTGNWVPIEEMPLHTPEAFVTLEDPSFFRHRGILVASLQVALEQNIEHGAFFRGGSTITQQLAKNLFLLRDKTILRKVNESLITTVLENCLTKNEILQIYLNVVEFGPGIYGIGPASHYHFNKDVSDLTLLESYYLASILPHPNNVTPALRGGLDRTKTLLQTLAKMGKVKDSDLPSDTDISVTPSDWVSE